MFNKTSKINKIVEWIIWKVDGTVLKRITIQETSERSGIIIDWENYSQDSPITLEFEKRNMNLGSGNSELQSK